MRRGSLILVVLMFCGAARAADFTFSSGVRRVSLVELYTSEGCSSCPRADAWLGALKDKPGLWKRFVPVAFDVDYWDGLGWPDRFAKPVWTERQRNYARHWRSRSVYTPGFAVDGKEWRGFFRGETLPDQPDELPGNLTLHSPDGRTWHINFFPHGAR